MAAAMLRSPDELSITTRTWDSEVNEHRVQLSKELNEALGELDGGFTDERVSMVKFRLYRILYSFIHEVVEHEFYSVSHFTKDSSGFCIDYLPSVVMGKKGFRFKVYFQEDPMDRSQTIAYILTRRHDADESARDYEAFYSQNHTVGIEAHAFRLAVQKAFIHKMEETMVMYAGQLGLELILKHVEGFVEIADDIWGFCGL